MDSHHQSMFGALSTKPAAYSYSPLLFLLFYVLRHGEHYALRNTDTYGMINTNKYWRLTILDGSAFFYHFYTTLDPSQNF